jgi:hypothetical protein
MIPVLSDNIEYPGRSIADVVATHYATLWHESELTAASIFCYWWAAAEPFSRINEKPK